MTQIASLLAVATVFIGLWTLISTVYCQGGEGAYMQDKTTYAGTWAKNTGGGAYSQDSLVHCMLVYQVW